jgi:hypothetical protein
MNYAKSALAVYNKLKPPIGIAITITSITAGAYDPATGESKLHSIEQNTFGLLSESGLQGSGQTAGVNQVLAGDKIIMIPAYGLSSFKIGDTVAIGMEVWVIVNIRETRPTDVPIYFDCQIRQ